jgi:hypothetical protein
MTTLVSVDQAEVKEHLRRFYPGLTEAQRKQIIPWILDGDVIYAVDIQFETRVYMALVAILRHRCTEYDARAKSPKRHAAAKRKCNRRARKLVAKLKAGAFVNIRGV